jgi:predicted ABC-type ATPase
MTTLARTKFQQVPILDPDAMARSLQETTDVNNSDIEGGRKVLREAEELIQARQSFTVETTLSGSTYLKMAVRAKDAGFAIVVFFVGTASVEINLARVQNRVKMGGHDVPEEDQRRRYPRTLANMRKLLPLADLAFIYDNSTAQGHVLVGGGHPGAMSWVEPLPEWVKNLHS